MNYWQQFCNSLSQPMDNEQQLVDTTITFLREILGWPDIEREFPVQVGHEIKRGDIMFADNSIIIEAMRLGSHNDLFIRSSQVAKLLGQKHGVQFGLVKGNRPGTRKVEIRVDNPAVFQTYFANHLDEIAQQIANLGGTYAPKNPAKIINCYFPVADNTTESYAYIFDIYTKFQQLILKYLKKEA